MKIKDKGCILLLGITSSFILLTGCSATNEAAPDKATSSTAAVAQVDYAKKIEILDQVRVAPSSVSVATEILADQWPKLFTARDADDLFQKYAQLTWHTKSESDRDRLKQHLQEHPEYQSYAELFKKGQLPAKKVTLTGIIAKPLSNQEESQVHASYAVHLKDGSQQEFQVDLTVNNNLELFNKKFNVEGDVEGQTLPAVSGEQEQKRRDFLLRVLGNQAKRLTHEQFLELLK